MKSAFDSKVTAFVAAGVAVILVLMPFHAFLTVWAASLVGHYTLLRLWKEFLIIPLGLAAFWLAWKRSLLGEMRRSWLFRLMAAYVFVQILLGLAAHARNQVNGAALAEGLIEDIRPVAIFFIAWVVASCSPWLRGHWQKLVFIPAAIVVAFGLLQAFVFPAGFLGHFGYGPATIRPYELVDLNNNFVRVQSTLRGANPLGAYLLVVIAVVAALLAKMNVKKHLADDKNWWLVALGVASLIVLYFTYSRSAYIGTGLTILIVLWSSVTNTRLRCWLLVVTAAACIVFGGLALVLRHNTAFEDTFFHTSQLSHSSQSSNQNRTSALQSGIHDVLHEPFGRGPGTAGPASVHNNHTARVSENYFLQIGQETGWLGLALFLSINFLIAKALWLRRHDTGVLPLTLLASLIGLTVVNLLSHAWADDTLAYLWWGLAGIALAPIMQTKAELTHGKTKKTKAESPAQAHPAR